MERRWPGDLAPRMAASRLLPRLPMTDDVFKTTMALSTNMPTATASPPSSSVETDVERIVWRAQDGRGIAVAMTAMDGRSAKNRGPRSQAAAPIAADDEGYSTTPHESAVGQGKKRSRAFVLPS